jgi:hypothetical protein
VPEVAHALRPQELQVENETTITEEKDIRPARTRSHRRWTPEELLRLEQLHRRGLTYVEIAEALDRPLRGVYMRVHRMRQAGQATYRCSGCGEQRPATEFCPAMHFDGGRCRACQNARRRMTTTTADGDGPARRS